MFEFEPAVIISKQYSNNKEIDKDVELYHNIVYQYLSSNCLGMAHFFGRDMFSSTPYFSNADLLVQLYHWAMFIRQNDVDAFSLSRLKKRDKGNYFIETCYINKYYAGARIIEKDLICDKISGILIPQINNVEKKVSFSFVANILHDILSAFDIDYDL